MNNLVIKIFIKDNFIQVNLQDMEYINGKLDKFTKASGKTD